MGNPQNQDSTLEPRAVCLPWWNELRVELVEWYHPGRCRIGARNELGTETDVCF